MGTEDRLRIVGVWSLRWPKRSLRYATTAALVSAHMSEGSAGVQSVDRALDHPRGAGPRRRGRGHRDRRRARRPQEHGVPAGQPRSRRTAWSSRPPSAGATGSASASCGWPARPPPGSTWSRRRGRSAASSRPTPARPSTSPCSPRARALYLDQVAGSSALQPHNWVGQHIPLHATSNGKVLLSGLDDERGHASCSAPCRATPPTTITKKGQAPRGARPGPRAGVRRRGRRARGGADRRGRPDPQRARRRGRLDERLRADVPARRRSGSRTSYDCSSTAAAEVSHRLGWGQR